MKDVGSITWQQEFAERAEAMRRDEVEFSQEPSAHGLVMRQPEMECDVCRHKDVYAGIGLFSGNIYDTINAWYCPWCQSVHKIHSMSKPLYDDPEEFLPIFRERLIKYPYLLFQTREFGICPECRGPARAYKVAAGNFDKNAHLFLACTNPECKWPGMHIAG